jgi:hypothetical protein
MKAIRAGVAFATFVALALFAQSHSKERSDAGAYPDKDRQLRIDYRGFDRSARNPNRTTPTPDWIRSGRVVQHPDFVPTTVAIAVAKAEIASSRSL